MVCNICGIDCKKKYLPLIYKILKHHKLEDVDVNANNLILKFMNKKNTCNKRKSVL